MKEKKLTAEDLRKAVEKIGTVENDMFDRKMVVLPYDLLFDFIYRLQDENEKYYNEAKDLRRKLNNDGAIYSRLEVDGFIDKERKETAEKFAERLKEMAYQSNDWSHGVHPMVVEVDYIDEICEEFTEGAK